MCAKLADMVCAQYIYIGIHISIPIVFRRKKNKIIKRHKKQADDEKKNLHLFKQIWQIYCPSKEEQNR